MKQLMQFMVGAIWIVTLLLSVVGWYRFYRCRQDRIAAVPYETRRPVPWGLIDLILIVLFFVLGQVVAGTIAYAIVGEAAATDSPIFVMGVSQAVLLVTWCCVLFAMRSRCQSPATDLGLIFRRRDLALGVVAFAMLAVPMFVLQAFLAQFTDKKHPLIEMLLEESSTLFFVVGGFAAVVVAPVVEEFFFRVFLQGWLENLAAYRDAIYAGSRFRPGYGADLFWGRGWTHERTWPTDQRPRDATQDLYNTDPLTSAGIPDGATDASPQPSGERADGEPTNPYAAPTAGIRHMTDGPLVDRIPVMRPSLWPILVSSLMFSAAHIGNGPDPIPLFFLALGLGYLYQRTHRVWPCVTVHCILNFVSLFNLWVIVNTPELVEKLLK